MKRRKLTICIVVIVLLIAGLFFILKPWIENKQAQKKQGEILSAIEHGEDSIDIELKGVKDDFDYYQPSSGITAITPLPTEESDQNNPLKQVDGLGVVEIGCIDLKLPIVSGVESEKLRVSVGHLNDSALFGEKGNCILVGHRNYTYGDIFNRLDEVKVGEVIVLTDIKGNTYNYKVYETAIVEPGSVRLFECDDEQYKLTLLTCTPIRTATHRILVLAELVN